MTHDQSEAMALSDRMLVMDMGVIQQVDTPQNMYNNPANKFVYSFLGLSNFINVEIVDGKVYPEGQKGQCLECPVEPGFCHTRGIIASRPDEISLAAEGGFRTRIDKRIFMSDHIEYRVKVGQKEIRVQTTKDKGFKENDSCGVIFYKPKWYKAIEDDSDKERERRKVI